MLRNIIISIILLGIFVMIAVLDVIAPDAIFFLVLAIIMIIALIVFYMEG